MPSLTAVLHSAENMQDAAMPGSLSLVNNLPKSAPKRVQEI